MWDLLHHSCTVLFTLILNTLPFYADTTINKKQKKIIWSLKDHIQIDPHTKKSVYVWMLHKNRCENVFIFHSDFVTFFRFNHSCIHCCIYVCAYVCNVYRKPIIAEIHSLEINPKILDFLYKIKIVYAETPPLWENAALTFRGTGL